MRSMFLAFWMLMTGVLFAAEPLTIVAPTQNELITGQSFYLTFDIDSQVTGFEFNIEVGDAVAGLGYQQAYSAHGTHQMVPLPVPKVEPNTNVKIKITSFKLHQAGVGQVSWSVTVRFRDSVPVLAVYAVQNSDRTLDISLLGDPSQAGTAIRLELDGNERQTYIGSVFNFTETQYVWRTAVPMVLSGSYRVRAISVWREVKQFRPVVAESMPLEVRGDPFLEVVWPTQATYVPGQRMHVLWSSKPQYVGTAMRFELWNGSNFVMNLGYDYHAEAENDFECTVPEVSPGNNYRVRAVSYWLENNRLLGLPSDAFSPGRFTIDNASLGRVEPELEGAITLHWEKNAAGLFDLNYTSNPNLFGTATRIELWTDPGGYSGLQRLGVIGYNWHNAATNSLALPDPYVSWRINCVVRVYSYWLEQNPRPGVLPYLQSDFFMIMSDNPLYFTRTDPAPALPSPLLMLNLTSRWQTVGSYFDFFLVPRNDPAQQFWIGAQSTLGPTTPITLPLNGWTIPPAGMKDLASVETPYSVETAYYVKVHSAWQESINGPNTDVLTPWVVYLKPEQ